MIKTTISSRPAKKGWPRPLSPQKLVIVLSLERYKGGITYHNLTFIE